MHYSKPVQDAINYINENLTAALSLEALADSLVYTFQQRFSVDRIYFIGIYF